MHNFNTYMYISILISEGQMKCVSYSVLVAYLSQLVPESTLTVVNLYVGQLVP